MRSKGLWVTIVVIIAVVVGALVFLGHRSKTADDSSLAPRQTDQPVTGEQSGSAVTMQGIAFSPATLTVKKGTTVTWTNQDGVEHNVVSDTDSPNGGLNGSLISKGEQFSFTFTTAGTYKYHCSIHPHMMATVVVTE